MLKRIVLLFLAIIVLSGCDHWVEKLAPESTGFARHCFELLQQRDFAALEALASPGLRDSGLAAQLTTLAGQIPAEAPIASEATSVNVATTNGYTVTRVTMVYQFQSGWLAFDVSAEGSDTLALTAISLRPTTAPVVLGFIPVGIAIFVGVAVLVVIGVVIYRRRAVATSAAPMAAPAPVPGMSRGWFGQERCELISPISRQECVARLHDAVGSRWSLFDTKPAIGRVGESSFSIRKRLRASFHNSLQTYLTGRLKADGAATRLLCRFGMHPFVIGFMAIWFGMLVCFTIAAIVALARGAIAQSNGMIVVGHVMMWIFGIGLVAFGRFLARNERQFLLDFLQQTIDARPVARPEPVTVERRK